MDACQGYYQKPQNYKFFLKFYIKMEKSLTVGIIRGITH